MNKGTIIFPVTKKVDNATSDILSTDIGINGRLICIQNISFTDETSSPTRVDLGFLRGPDFIPLRSFLAPAAGFTVIHDNETWLHIGDKPAARVIGGTLNDQLQLVITGYVYQAQSED